MKMVLTNQAAKPSLAQLSASMSPHSLMKSSRLLCLSARSHFSLLTYIERTPEPLSILVFLCPFMTCHDISVHSKLSSRGHASVDTYPCLAHTCII